MCGNPTLNGSHHGNAGPVVLDPPARFALYLTAAPEEPTPPDNTADTDEDLDELDEPDDADENDADDAAVDTLSLADLLAVIKREAVLDPDRVIGWGLATATWVVVTTRDGRVHRFTSPESARAILGRRLRRQLSLTYV